MKLYEIKKQKNGRGSSTIIDWVKANSNKEALDIYKMVYGNIDIECNIRVAKKSVDIVEPYGKGYIAWYQDRGYTVEEMKQIFEGWNKLRKS